MQHLNYCRQMVKQFSATLQVPNLPRVSRHVLSHAVDLASASVKFLLPRGGRLFDDHEFKALDEAEALRLPHPMIALEYEQGPEFGPASSNEEKSSKRIVFARERDDGICVMPVIWADAYGMWAPAPEVWLPITQYLNREKIIDGRVSIRIGHVNPQVPLSDYGDEIGALLCFLNALQCSNVHTELSVSGRTQKSVRKKGALPFDDYHILTIDVPGRTPEGTSVGGSHRSPREHLRRGHIRRLQDGRKLWINATVVNPGVGGKVTKDYRVAA